MQDLVGFFLNNSEYIPYVFFGLIVLAGFNIPISLDMVVVSAAFVASKASSSQALVLFFAVLVGAMVSAWVCYWIGRTVVGKLLKVRVFSALLPIDRINKMRGVYNTYGLAALIVGRFIPFGVRNCIFMSIGLGGGTFASFIWKDGLACVIWTAIIFPVAYKLCGCPAFMGILKTCHVGIFVVFVLAVSVFVFFKWRNGERFPCGRK